jgi:hypothetical protein
MPLLDHFRPPLYPERRWESFHASWADAIAAGLNRRGLPDGYYAENLTHVGARVEIDVATFHRDRPADRNGAGGTATLAARTYAPPEPTAVVPAAFTDEFEVRVYETIGGARLVATVELVSPANKDRADHRRAFVQKCAGYLAQGIAVAVVDVVTTRRASLHAELVATLGAPAAPDADSDLYAASYRPIVRDGEDRIEIWTYRLALGAALPTIPLALNAEVCVPIDLEAAYLDACDRKGIR